MILKKYPFEASSISIKREKKNIFKFISKTIHKKVKQIKNIFYTSFMKLGNNLAALNKIIFYCEIIGCSKIILDKEKFFLIKRKIKIPKYNLTISVEDIKFKNNYELFYNKQYFLFSMFIFKPEIRLNLIRKEIIKKLIKINISKYDLYIHIRSGDIFKKVKNRFYSQPPLCFYEKILNNYKYKKIFIISGDGNNPVISKLKNKYPNIIYKFNSMIYDISVLINAYNIVNSISSFLNLIL